MVGLTLVPIFMVGLLGGVHCVTMCGGIVGAFSMAPTAKSMHTPQTFPVAVRTATQHIDNLDTALRIVAYNTGRIGSYMLAGAIAGGLVGGARTLSNLSQLQAGGYWLANLMLIALGLHLMDAWRGLTWLEAAGQVVWRRIQPLMQHLLPLDSPLKLLVLGGLWGWLPCGMVYSVLVTAMLTGSAISGATVMLVFGLGTLPTLLTMGVIGMPLRKWARKRAVRVACGLIVLGFGALGLMRAANGMQAGWLDMFCLSPPVMVQR